MGTLRAGLAAPRRRAWLCRRATASGWREGLGSARRRGRAPFAWDERGAAAEVRAAIANSTAVGGEDEDAVGGEDEDGGASPPPVWMWVGEGSPSRCSLGSTGRRPPPPATAMQADAFVGI